MSAGILRLFRLPALTFRPWNLGTRTTSSPVSQFCSSVVRRAFKGQSRLAWSVQSGTYQKGSKSFRRTLPQTPATAVAHF